ncbi:Myosin-12 [Canna indica]|uniref:Myosin-12 n=1 Tax=Canna indica TaxID=4628 RepID=A0AAQ3KNG2_9LILI|nr:Myosin-12 [Canna indica]
MAARETGALKEAKNKLEKKVEELTWRLELVEKRMRENHEALIKCLKEYKSFDNKRPATTLIVYKSLFHWHSFEAERTNIFERIIQTIRSFVENQENIGELAYWLSTTSTLLFLLQKNLRESNASSTGSYRSRATTSSFFSRIAQNARSSSSIMGISSGYSGMLGKPGSQSRIEARSGTIGESPKSILSNNMAKQASNIHWQSIVKSLDSTLNILCENYVIGTHRLWQVLHQKSQKTLEEIRNEICPVLSVPQIYRIGTMFWDDEYGGAKSLSQEVNGESYRDIIGL